MRKIITRLLPKNLKDKIKKSIKSDLKNNILNQIKRNRQGMESAMPKFSIEEKHIINTRLIRNRETLLNLLSKNGVVAEIGVDEGEFSQKIKSICSPQKLHLIDLWGSERYNQNKRKSVEKLFNEEIITKSK